MALGCLLYVSWICVLLFDGSTGLPAIKGYGYPYTSDSRNIGDVEDEVLTSPTFESNWQVSHSQPTDPVHTSYNPPSVAQQPASVPELPTTPTAPEEARLVNGDPRDWGLGNHDEPLTFPLRPNYQPSEPAPQPDPVQTQSAPFNVPSSDATYASPSTGDATRYASATAYFEPAPSHTASFDSWQPEPVSGGYGVADSSSGSPIRDFNTGSSAHGGDSTNVPHLVFEEVFQYPSGNAAPSPSYGGVSNTAGGYNEAHYMSEGSSTGNVPEPSFPSYPANVGAQPVHAPAGEVSHTSYRPHTEETASRLPEKPVIHTQRVSEQIYPSYYFQSRNGYQQGRSVFSQTRYLPEFPPPMPVSSTSVKGPVESQPAAPTGVKNPERPVLYRG